MKTFHYDNSQYRRTMMAECNKDQTIHYSHIDLDFYCRIQLNENEEAKRKKRAREQKIHKNHNKLSEKYRKPQSNLLF